MKRNYKILVWAIFTIVIAWAVVIGSCSIRTEKYESGFQKVNIGQPKQSVINLMGQPSKTRSCSSINRYEFPNDNCVEIFGYLSFFDYWAVAFDKDENVIKKYYWTFDDGYGKPSVFGMSPFGLF